MARDSNKSSTVIRAFNVLELLAQSESPASASELAVKAGLERVTCYRMLRTLEEAGYALFDEEDKTFRLSKRPIFLAKRLMAQDATWDRIEAVLKRVAERTGETCHYSELDGDSTILTQRAKGRQLVAVDFQIGTRCELHATSVGKAILAYRPQVFQDIYLSKPLKKYTNLTKAEPEQLKEELARVMQTGMSFDIEELAEGMNCVAVPIKTGPRRVLGGISISGPNSRLTKARLLDLAQVMKQEVAQMEED